MEIKLLLKWQSYGPEISVSGPSPEPWQKLASPAKKQLTATKKEMSFLRAEFESELLTLKPEQIVYADEAGMDNRDDYGYGYNQRGERFYALFSGRRTGRVNMIAALCDHQPLACPPFTLEGAGNRTVFELWLESCTGPGVETGTGGGDG